MKVLILAGGFGSRLGEETSVLPKPMVEIGGKPILWHIMKHYSSYGFNEFIVLLGYKGYVIKEYFTNYFLHSSDFTIDLKDSSITKHSLVDEDWKVTLLDTGLDTLTGGRIKRAAEFVQEERFMMTYGDGVSNVDIDKLLEFHNGHGRLCTMTSVQPDGRFGSFEERGDSLVTSFIEKPKGDGSWINGGFFVCEPKVMSYISKGDRTVFEREPLQDLAKDEQLFAYRHEGFWKCMDTLKDKQELEAYCDSGEPPWKTW